jgi:hypothetical protein
MITGYFFLNGLKSQNDVQARLPRRRELACTFIIEQYISRNEHHPQPTEQLPQNKEGTLSSPKGVLK